MITKIEIDGFKTFRHFHIEFSPFTVIAGANASGKSNLFDALKLLGRITETDLRTAFSEQRGESNELFTQFGEECLAEVMTFTVELLLNQKIKDNWGGEAKLKYTRLRYKISIGRRKGENGIEDLYINHEHLETIKHDEDSWVKKHIPKNKIEFWRPKVPAGRRTTPYIETKESHAIIIRQDDKGGNKKEYSIAAGITQSILSGVNSVDFKHAFAVKEELRNWKFLQLNPAALREPTRQDIGMRDTITQSGENLAAALYRIKINNQYALRNISRKLNNLLPNLIEVDVINDKANKQFIIKVKSEDGRVYSSRVLSEGTLRLLALCIFQYDDLHNGLLCFEEPENGIHPARIKEMTILLENLSIDFNDTDMPLRQVVVNTHSPILVSEVFQIKNKKNVTVWLSQLVTQIDLIGNKRMKFHISKLLPVDFGNQYSFDFSDVEKKFTLAEVDKYLKSADFEKIKTNLLKNE